MSLNPLNRDDFPKALKVLCVVREQRWNVIGLHGGDDIGVMHLFAADFEMPHQVDELAGNGGGVVCHLKVIFQMTYPLDYYLRC